MAWSQQQIDALGGTNPAVSPDQSKNALSKSNNFVQQLSASTQQQETNAQMNNNTFSTPSSEILSGQGKQAGQQGIGALKQVASDISSAGAQNAGPVGKAMLANAPAFAQDVNAAKNAMQPANFEQTKGAIGTSIGEALVPIGAISESGAPAKLASKLKDTLTEGRLSASADILTKKELTEPGRVLPSGKVAASKTEQRAAALMKGKTFINPVKTQAAIADEIGTRGKEAETFLEAAKTPITNKEDFDAFQAVRSSSSKYMTPAEQSAYDEQIGVFQKILKGYGEYNTSNYYKALKEYESQVTANIPKGKDALLVPGGSARIQAAKDVRTVVRDMIGKKNPPFKGKMFDLASLYDAQDNVSARVADKAKNSTTFGKRHPVLKKTATYGAEAIGAGLLYEGAKDSGAPLP